MPLIISSAASLGLTALVRALAQRCGLVARDERRARFRAVPRIGGIALFAAFALAACCGGMPSAMFGSRLVWLAASLCFAVGFVDDLRPVPGPAKLAALTIAGALVACDGTTLRALPYVGPVPASIGICVTALWVAAVASAWNLVDGLDGLAAGVTAVSAFGLALADASVAPAAAALAGAACGFVVHNRAPARIFMGDSGSFFLGFWIALLALRSSVRASDEITLVAAALPLCDLVFVMVRRLVRGEPLFAANCDHVHYRLAAALGDRGAVAVTTAATGAAMVGVVASRGGGSALVGATVLGAATVCLFSARLRLYRVALVLVVTSLSLTQYWRPSAAARQTIAVDEPADEPCPGAEALP